MMGRKAPFVLCCQQLKKLKLLLYQNPIKASNNLPALINTARISVSVYKLVKSVGWVRLGRTAC